REFTYPWWGIVTSLTTIFSSKGPLSFKALHNLTELGPILVVLSLLILGIVGPWRFRKAHIAYVLLGVVWMFFNLSEPVHEALFPLRAQARYALEVFPAFVVLAVLGRYRTVHLSYTLVSTVAMCSIALQFLTGHWIT
ncbi:MAG: hypothetical protein J2P37_16040, partial [Ktedonobacteraceae bacterium]|nr:hypothetical protein [Ktedonobacteraceae bacterium]